jgi:hypothetical protein
METSRSTYHATKSIHNTTQREVIPSKKLFHEANTSTKRYHPIDAQPQLRCDFYAPKSGPQPLVLGLFPFRSENEKSCLRIRYSRGLIFDRTGRHYHYTGWRLPRQCHAQPRPILPFSWLFPQGGDVCLTQTRLQIPSASEYRALEYSISAARNV